MVVDNLNNEYIQFTLCAIYKNTYVGYILYFFWNDILKGQAEVVIGTKKKLINNL